MGGLFGLEEVLGKEEEFTCAAGEEFASTHLWLRAMGVSFSDEGH